MQVFLLSPRVGKGINQQTGEIVTVPDDEGRRMIASGGARSLAPGEALDWAAAHGRTRQPETATSRKAARAEHAVSRTPRLRQ